MGWHFDPNRVTQAAGYLMKLSASSHMPYMKLLKLLYFADRQSLAEKGYPITGDIPFAMDYGPVLSHVYDYIKCRPRSGVHIWVKHFTVDGFDLQLRDDPGTGDLSRHDIRVLHATFAKYQDMTGFDMSTLSHDLPEWKEVFQGDGTSTEIPTSLILHDLGYDDAGVASVVAKANEERAYFNAISALTG